LPFKCNLQRYIVVHAVSGYSGGGKALMKIHHDGEAEPWGAYAFNLNHKHLPEMAEYSKVGRKPVFCPAVGRVWLPLVTTLFSTIVITRFTR
jgi:N-acetyl-gamma-glutamylphosphate reductase